MPETLSRFKNILRMKNKAVFLGEYQDTSLDIILLTGIVSELDNTNMSNRIW